MIERPPNSEVATREAGSPVLEIRGLMKAFGAEQALADAELMLQEGEIRALVGANGSGKSTLVKILAGYYHADGGSIRVHGDELDLSQPGGAPGFRFVHQDLALIGELTVSENLMLGEDNGGVVRPVTERAQNRAVQPLIDSYDLGFKANATVGSLSAADRTMVAVMRAFRSSQEPIKVLVLDEVTASLPPREVERLFASIRRLRPSGVAVLFVSHRIEEILDLCDTATVLRDGRSVAQRQVADTSERELVRLITGREPAALYPALSPSGRRTVLTAENVAGGPVQGVSLELHEGEIVGVASIDPSETSALLRLLYGSERRDGGTLSLEGRVVAGSATPPDMSILGVTLVTDRMEAGIQGFSVRENLTLNRVRTFYTGGFLRQRAERRAARQLIADYEIVPPSSEAAFASLSGGNQQKAILAKSMRLEPKVLLLDDPARGVDIGAKALLFSRIREAAEGGLAVLFSSTDFDELCGVCHRVIVLRQGRSSAVVEGEGLSPHEILERCYLGSEAIETDVRQGAGEL